MIMGEYWNIDGYTLWWFDIAIEHGPVEIVSFPTWQMLIFDTCVALYQRVSILRMCRVETCLFIWTKSEAPVGRWLIAYPIIIPLCAASHCYLIKLSIGNRCRISSIHSIMTSHRQCCTICHHCCFSRTNYATLVLKQQSASQRKPSSRYHATIVIWPFILYLSSE